MSLQLRLTGLFNSTRSGIKVDVILMARNGRYVDWIFASSDLRGPFRTKTAQWSKIQKSGMTSTSPPGIVWFGSKWLEATEIGATQKGHGKYDASQEEDVTHDDVELGEILFSTVFPASRAVDDFPPSAYHIHQGYHVPDYRLGWVVTVTEAKELLKPAPEGREPIDYYRYDLLPSRWGTTKAKSCVNLIGTYGITSGKNETYVYN
ncbi:hypothetical protein F5876DRAFT_82940 [Lentinula aff. lateritia]|uniref:Uncharacterized protein n=1 Tax=Lentinula aff. lateritia TaxID=2804960 RepID=A0ACC1TJ94_9AGAR|nr:hypothetical protein F5876DRAFT_82940 [Lentinula aff. lateritia]